MINGLTYVALSDIGEEREENQDYQGHDLSHQGMLFIVADGMGGHAGGATASQMVVNHMKRRARELAVGTPEAVLSESIRYANRAIWTLAQQRADLHGMGSTVVAVLIREDRAWIAHVGDSRIYLLRGGRLHQLTKDHTMVQRLVDEGFLKPEEAEKHPSSHILARSLGGREDVEVESGAAPLALQVGDTFLLCSDGLTGMLADPEIGQILHEFEPHDALRLLVDEANARGGYDNTTLALLRIDALPIQNVIAADVRQLKPPRPRRDTPPEPPAPILPFEAEAHAQAAEAAEADGGGQDDAQDDAQDVQDAQTPEVTAPDPAPEAPDAAQDPAPAPEEGSEEGWSLPDAAAPPEPAEAAVEPAAAPADDAAPQQGEEAAHGEEAAPEPKEPPPAPLPPLLPEPLTRRKVEMEPAIAEDLLRTAYRYIELPSGRPKLVAPERARLVPPLPREEAPEVEPVPRVNAWIAGVVALSLGLLLGIFLARGPLAAKAPELPPPPAPDTTALDQLRDELEIERRSKLTFHEQLKEERERSGELTRTLTERDATIKQLSQDLQATKEGTPEEQLSNTDAGGIPPELKAEDAGAAAPDVPADADAQP